MGTATAVDETWGIDTTICGRCSARYAHDAWVSLPLVRRLDSTQVSRVASRWPTGMAVEVRRCVRCEASIARKCPGSSR
jgi:hypothetical protein